MRITFVNVGYGDAILMESDTGYTALLDGGGNLPQEFEGDPYRVRCAEYLRTRQIHHIDALLISHIHEDHVCGLLPVLKDVSVGAIYVGQALRSKRRGGQKCSLVYGGFEQLP